MAGVCGRFAPSVSGPPHVGTLLAALLAWCDARSRGGRVVLRLEDLDPQRSRRAWGEAIVAATAWLGLDWDAVTWQSAGANAHAAALRQLAEQGRLYACTCSRARRRAAASLPAAGADGAAAGADGAAAAPDGAAAAGGDAAGADEAAAAPDGATAGADGAAAGGDAPAPYRNTCRGRRVTAAALRADGVMPGTAGHALRARLPDAPAPLRQCGAVRAPLDPRQGTGDPIVRRRDGAIAYMLAGIVDDAAAGVTCVIRGRDLACCAAAQAALRAQLGLPQPQLRHHLLLRAPAGAKLSKSDAAGAGPELTAGGGAALCGRLACAVGLRPTPRPCTPRALLASFHWDAVRADDVTLADPAAWGAWGGGR